MKSKSNPHPSDSRVQREAEPIIIKRINNDLSLNLISKKIQIEGVKFEFDGYSEDPPIICEVYSRIGELKSAQKYKVTKDILKMELFTRMEKRKFRKIFSFVDKVAAKSFQEGKSWVSKIKDVFECEVIVQEIPKSLRSKILSAQERQKMKNV